MERKSAFRTWYFILVCDWMEKLTFILSGFQPFWLPFFCWWYRTLARFLGVWWARSGAIFLSWSWSTSWSGPFPVPWSGPLSWSACRRLLICNVTRWRAASGCIPQSRSSIQVTDTSRCASLHFHLVTRHPRNFLSCWSSHLNSIITNIPISTGCSNTHSHLSIAHWRLFLIPFRTIPQPLFFWWIRGWGFWFCGLISGLPRGYWWAWSLWTCRVEMFFLGSWVHQQGGCTAWKRADSEQKAAGTKIPLGGGEVTEWHILSESPTFSEPP